MRARFSFFLTSMGHWFLIPIFQAWQVLKGPVMWNESPLFFQMNVSGSIEEALMQVETWLNA